MKKLFKGVLALVVLLSLLNSAASAEDGFGSTIPRIGKFGGATVNSFMLGCNKDGC